MDLKAYNKLNNSFKKEYIFHVGAEAGLYSEINNMIFSILYCLKYGYKFKLYSKDANFGFKNGWEDYFLPFCEETKFPIHHFFNKRTTPPVFSEKETLKKIIYKGYRKLNNKTSLTFDLWNKFLSFKFNDDFFDIPELGIKGNLNHACNKLIEIIYQLNSKVIAEVEKYKAEINLPKEYISFQIRRGDKNLEKEYVPFEKYFDYLEQNSTVKNLFILADDYSSIVEVSEKFPHYNIFTLTDPADTGYIHADFIKLTKVDKKIKIVRLLTSIEIMRQADTILGVFAANTELFLGMAEPQKMVWLDGHEWCILHKKTEGLTSDMIDLLGVKGYKL
jgi:hypothetical protein